MEIIVDSCKNNGMKNVYVVKKININSNINT